MTERRHHIAGERPRIEHRPLSIRGAESLGQAEQITLKRPISGDQFSSFVLVQWIVSQGVV
ncbi:hypothetical protein Maq22A_c25145 [Methylobacterium aquaticum]|uniref:Uncharacterized protein n=1 Tax=Methylobacterium aquaticum TaxID=270351 RepID=A0A0C6FRC5_9HYPH|nr:hypothetical protein Maq22A_c25145 [Methylobacterium aquaticum]